MRKVEPIPDTFLRECQQKIEEDNGIEEMLIYLRENKFSIVQSILALVNLKGMSLSEAKKTVHFSKAWKSERYQYDAFHQKLDEEANNLNAD